MTLFIFLPKVMTMFLNDNIATVGFAEFSQSRYNFNVWS